MGKADRLAGLAMLVSLGCSFDSAGSDTSKLGTSAGATSGPTTDDTVEGSTGDDAGSGSAEGETSLGGSTSVGSEEACVDSCVPQVPSGWQGPFYVADAANAIECPNGYNAIDVAYSGLQAPEAECGCSCDTTPATCEVSVELSAPACISAIAVTVQPGEGCETLPSGGLDVHARARMNGSPIGCTPNVQQTIAPAEWDTTSTLCAAPARGGDCDGERCTALPPEGVATSLCISKDGEQECPGAGFGQRRVLHRGVHDQRSCEGCNCSGPPSCTGGAFAHDSPSCDGGGQAVGIDQCVDIDISSDYGISAFVDGGSCTTTQATPAGQATPTGAVTLCCAT